MMMDMQVQDGGLIEKVDIVKHVTSSNHLTCSVKGSDTSFRFDTRY